MPTTWHFVTGCDSGFGSVVVKMLAEKGFGVFATHYLEASAETLRGCHTNIVPLHVDITKQESVDDAAKAVDAKLSSITGAQLVGLVNNAGLMLQAGPVEWTPASNYEAMFAVNVVGAVRVTNSLLPLLRRSKGRIVNVASIAGRFGLVSQSAYCASKFAMEGYSEVLRRELFDWGVTVHIIEPGIFKNTKLYSTYHGGTDTLWKALPEKVQADYGEPYKKEFSEKLAAILDELGSTDNSLVPKAMVQALTASRPRYRYQVGTDSKFLVPLFNFLHESWQDWLFRLRKPGEARIIGSTCDPNALKVSLGRYQHTRWYFVYLAILYFLFKLRRH